MKQLFTLLLLAISVQLFAQSYPITSITISLPTSSSAVTYKIKIVEIKGDQ